MDEEEKEETEEKEEEEEEKREEKEEVPVTGEFLPNIAPGSRHCGG